MLKPKRIKQPLKVVKDFTYMIRWNYYVELAKAGIFKTVIVNNHVYVKVRSQLIPY